MNSGLVATAEGLYKYKYSYIIGTSLDVIHLVKGTVASGDFGASHQPSTTSHECLKRKNKRRCKCINERDSTDRKRVGFMCIIDERMPCVTSSTLSKGSLALSMAARISGATPRLGLGLISAATHIARSPGNAAEGMGPRSRYSLRSWSGFLSYPRSYTMVCHASTKASSSWLRVRVCWWLIATGSFKSTHSTLHVKYSSVIQESFTRNTLTPTTSM